MTIEKELAKLTNDFTDKEAAVRCYTVKEKEQARNIFKKYYNNVEVSDGRRSEKDKMNWVIVGYDLKNLQESFKLNEADDDLDLSEFEDYDINDDMDLDEYNLDSIDDSGEVADANQLTILKKRAGDLATKWQDTFKQISDLARKLDLVASHDEDLNIEIKKANGKPAEVKQDLDKIKSKLLEPEDEEVDDSFGPSDFDDRASKLGPDVEIKEESLQQLPATRVNEEYPWNKNDGTIDFGHSEDPNELYLDPNMVDDDM